jgi:hypothetical protein
VDCIITESFPSIGFDCEDVEPLCDGMEG